LTGYGQKVSGYGGDFYFHASVKGVSGKQYFLLKVIAQKNGGTFKAEENGANYVMLEVLSSPSGYAVTAWSSTGGSFQTKGGGGSMNVVMTPNSFSSKPAKGNVTIKGNWSC